jgi:hypothetical protein
MSRSRIYELIAEGRIKSICLKSRKGAARGLRLIDREAIDWFMTSLEKENSRTMILTRCRLHKNLSITAKKIQVK